MPFRALHEEFAMVCVEIEGAVHRVHKIRHCIVDLLTVMAEANAVQLCRVELEVTTPTTAFRLVLFGLGFQLLVSLLLGLNPVTIERLARFKIITIGEIWRRKRKTCR